MTYELYWFSCLEAIQFHKCCMQKFHVLETLEKCCMQELHVRETLDKCCMQELHVTRKIFMSHARGACVHARTFQDTWLRQVDSFLVERECWILQQDIMKLASRNNMTSPTLVWDHKSCSDGSYRHISVKFNLFNKLNMCQI